MYTDALYHLIFVISCSVNDRFFFQIITLALFRPGFLTWTQLFSFASVGLTYEQSAVKLVVGALKSGTVLSKTHAHIGLLTVTYVCSCLLIYSI